MARVQDVWFLVERGAKDLDRFPGERSPGHGDHGWRDTRTFEGGATRLDRLRRGGRDEADVHAGRKGPQQMIRSQMPAGIERPGDLAGHSQDRRPAAGRQKHVRYLGKHDRGALLEPYQLSAGQVEP